MKADPDHLPEKLYHEAKPGFRSAFLVTALFLFGYLAMILVSSPGPSSHPDKSRSHKPTHAPSSTPEADHE
jgi:hypothetical protein